MPHKDRPGERPDVGREVGIVLLVASGIFYEYGNDYYHPFGGFIFRLAAVDHLGHFSR